MTGRLQRDGDPDLGFPTIERRAMLQGVLARMRRSARSEPVSIDRFTFVRRLGAGGMGIVYLVHDPELDRLVALKLLHPSLADEDADAIARRMRSEARAMARLDHPNVVRVLEVGEHEGRIFIVMEYVEGTTLSQWLAARPTIGWREIARVFLAAGEGLAAAHAAGLAHCDFKPDNVLIGVNGAVRVSDFGLVRAYEDAMGEWVTTLDGSKRNTGASTNHLAGTPAFMAPEQLEGRRATPLSDQFSFGVALYTALHGKAPFRGDTLDELRRAVTAGLRSSAKKRRRIPRELERLLARGLAADPDARWPELEQLLTALRRILGARKRRLRYAALGLAGLVGFGFAGVKLYERHDRLARTEACVAEGQTIDEVWNESTHASLREALSAASLAPKHLRTVIGALDRHARSWAHVRTEACLDARVRGVWDDDTLERSRWCLDSQRMAIEALVEELSRPDVPLLQATQAARLPPAERCRDPIRLHSAPTPPSNRSAVAAVMKQLWRVRALVELGQYDEGVRVAQSTQAAADALGWAPLSAEVRSDSAKLSLHLGDRATAEATLEQAYFEAVDAGADEVAVRAATELVRLTVDRRVDALRWSRHAEVLFNRLEIPRVHTQRVPLMHNLAIVHRQHGEYERARSLLEQELALLEPLLGQSHPHVARTLLELAGVDLETGAVAQSEELGRRALSILDEWFGSDHPLVGLAHVLHGRALAELGQLEESRAELELALALEEQAFEPNHARLIKTFEALASTLEQLGEVEQAALMRERAATLREHEPKNISSE